MEGPRKRPEFNIFRKRPEQIKADQEKKVKRE